MVRRDQALLRCGQSCREVVYLSECDGGVPRDWASHMPTLTHSAVFFSLQSLCLTHTGKPTGVAVSHCITCFQTQLILTRCQIRYHGHCGIIVALDRSEP